MNEKFKNMSEELTGSAHKVWLAGLGALTMAGEEGSKLFKTLVERGEEFEGRDSASVDSVKKSMEKTRGRAEEFIGRMEEGFNERVVGVLQKMGVPTSEEIAQLSQRIDALMDAVNNLKGDSTDEDKTESN